MDKNGVGSLLNGDLKGSSSGGKGIIYVHFAISPSMLGGGERCYALRFVLETE